MCWNRVHSQSLEVGVSRPREARSKLAVVCLVVALCAACGPSEDDLRRDVRARLDADPAVAPLALSIEVKRQVVYLSGKTATPAEQQQAIAHAKEVKGVKLVVNDMWLNNTTLADKVKEALAQDAVVGKIPIEVEAQGKLVRLSSDRTNREERERIVKIASAVEGVAEVEDRMK
jgi:osmotically-inducible protein OsmY